jgi:hypothetical protein
MSNPFAPCPSVNTAGLRCYLCQGHRGGIHEVHPAERGKSRAAGASPVWSDADLVPSCRFCGAPLSRDRNGGWASTWPSDDAPWTCPASASGHAPYDADAPYKPGGKWYSPVRKPEEA